MPSGLWAIGQTVHQLPGSKAGADEQNYFRLTLPEWPQRVQRQPPRWRSSADGRESMSNKQRELHTQGRTAAQN